MGVRAFWQVVKLNLRSKLRNLARRKHHLFHLTSRFKHPLMVSQFGALSPSRDTQYAYCVHYFDRFVPESIREHRRYFTSEQRGFGEDAFHAMWFLLFEEFRPASALEIGVYRGQTITLWKMLARHFGFDCQVGCISPFTPAGDAVSQYANRIDYFEDVIRNHAQFNLELPQFCRHYSTAPEARHFALERQWEIIYIDGNHDYPVARKDWDLSVAALAPRGIIVLDDSALGTEYSPPCFATAGHPGPSQVAREIDPNQFKEILSVGHNRVFQRL